MKLFFLTPLIAFSLTLSCHIAFAQNTFKNLTDSLTGKFGYYNLKKQEGILYAHFDKTIYTNNENVWFTAYLLNNSSESKSDVLSVVLVKDNDHSIAMEEKFVMAENISLGNLFLPDTIPAGDYSFMLYTNNVSNGKPTNIFTQPVTIKNTTETSFSATLDLLDTAKFPVDGKRKILLVTNAKGDKIISGASVNYYVGDKLHPVISGKVKTDRAGQYLFAIPVQDITLGNNLLEARITYGSEKSTTKLVLPVYKNELVVRFYPEGGYLSNGIISTVGWEVKNTTGNPCKVTGVLYKDGQATDTIATNSYGMGKFSFIPRKGSHYFMKLLLADFRDSVYNLPQIMPDLPVVTIRNALACDTLQLVVKNKQLRKVYIAVHNYKQLFNLFPVTVHSKGKTIKIILDDVPKGISEITVLDSLQRPLAGRLFFAHYDQRNTLSINTDHNEYKTRQKVTLKLNLKDDNNKPIAGFVSIACVQANRTELKKANDIVSYCYLENDLGRLPVKENLMGNSNDDKAYLEDVLLIKGWRRYTWTEFANTTAKDTIKQSDTLKFKGAITYADKPLKKPAELVVIKDSLSKFSTLATNSTGGFTINNDALLITENKKLRLMLTGENNEGYHIIVDDPYKKINQLIAADYQPRSYLHYLPNQKGEGDENLTGLEHEIHLNEVKIKGKNENVLYGIAGIPGSNACGDYVCIYNILNCPNHRDDLRNRAPVKGETYTYKGQTFYTYLGCMVDPYEHSLVFNGIQYAMEFYPADYSQLNPPGPEFLSIVYWKHLYKISPENKDEISFYTSDITGNFKIIVQGIGGNDVVSGEKTIRVAKP